ncbi:hypothetical protein M5D96_007327 [Drosophila gunungcola]|uniref:Uncharacterized protein n=1 Tax=Drosophila gunungcola TaxID=103775 RepID=A0A9Q0BPF2_9MUSC|nr:hypothetical protein M5D96_007327 [Drosophila gunungcola]
MVIKLTIRRLYNKIGRSTLKEKLPDNEIKQKKRG